MKFVSLVSTIIFIALMKPAISLLGTFFTALFLLILTACNDKEPDTARLIINMTDAPGDYQEVNVDIQSIEVNVSENGDETGWRTLNNVNRGIFNLLKLTNGIDTVLADEELPAGFISQIRLILGENNTLKMDDQILDLSTPSAQQSGLKLQVNSVLSAGITYEVLLDFDAARSVVEAGNSGKFNLKPVIRTIVEAQDGAIGGVVLPLEATPALFAIQGSDTLASAFTDENGAFLLRGLAAGSYTVSISPASNYLEQSLENVKVTLGQITDVGVVQLSQ